MTQSLGVPCFLGGMSRGLLGRNSPIHIRQRRRDALREADVVILAGMRTANSQNMSFYLRTYMCLPLVFMDNIRHSPLHCAKICGTFI